MVSKVPRDLRLLAAESSLDGDKAAFARCKELSINLHKLREQCETELLSLLGSKANEYLQFQRKLRDYSQDMRSLYTPTPIGEKMKDTFRKKSLAEAREFIRALGVNTNDIKTIKKRYQEQARVIAEKEMDITDSPYVEVSSTEFPKRTNNPWTWRDPPFDGIYGFQYSYYSGDSGGATSSHYENSVTGELSCSSDTREYDAGNSDYSLATAISTVLVWYQMPATGLIETWADLQSIDTYYGGSVRDEWGVSRVSVQQLSRAYLQVVYPSEGRERWGTLLDYQLIDNEGQWWANVTPPGSHLYPHLFSLDVYPAGQWVLMRIGICDFNYVTVDDMNFWSTMVNRWLLRDIPIRSTGAE